MWWAGKSCSDKEHLQHQYWAVWLAVATQEEVGGLHLGGQTSYWHSRRSTFCTQLHQQFYTAPKESVGGRIGWSEELFNHVAWKHLNVCITSKSDTYYVVWLAKQVLGVCATRKKNEQDSRLAGWQISKLLSSEGNTETPESFFFQS